MALIKNPIMIEKILQYNQFSSVINGEKKYENIMLTNTEK